MKMEYSVPKGRASQAEARALDRLSEHGVTDPLTLKHAVRAIHNTLDQQIEENKRINLEIRAANEHDWDERYDREIVDMVLNSERPTVIPFTSRLVSGSCEVFPTESIKDMIRRELREHGRQETLKDVFVAYIAEFRLSKKSTVSYIVSSIEANRIEFDTWFNAKYPARKRGRS